MSCMVSNVGDMWGQRLPQKFPQIPWDQLQGLGQFPPVTRAEFDALKSEIAEMKEMLRRAKAFDEKIGSPNCEVEEKMALLRKIADLVGLSLDDVLGQAKP